MSRQTYQFSKNTSRKNYAKTKEFVNDLDYSEIKFHVSKEGFSKIEMKNNIFINVFCYENKLIFPIYISDQKFENSMDLLLIFDGDKLHYVYIKGFYRFMFHKTKSTFAKTVYSALVVNIY